MCCHYPTRHDKVTLLLFADYGSQDAFEGLEKVDNRPLSKHDGITSCFDLRRFIIYLLM